MKFNVHTYLNAKDKYVIKNGYGSVLHFVAFDPEAKDQNVIIRDDDGTLRNYSTHGVFMSSGEESDMDLVLEEIVETFEYEGFAYLDGRTLVGLHLPSMMVNGSPVEAKAHRCVITVEIKPVNS